MSNVIEGLLPGNRVCPCGFDPINQFETRSYIYINGPDLSILTEDDDVEVLIRKMTQYACPICGTMFIIP